MKTTTVTVSFDEEKLSALKLYLKQRGTQPEEELEKALESLYTKTVPVGVREFIEMRSGSTPTPPKVKKPKPSASSAVGVARSPGTISQEARHD